MKIKTADQILEKHIEETMSYKSYKGILDAMKEYAEQFIDLAIEENYNAVVYDDYISIIDEEDLIKIKQLIK